MATRKKAPLGRNLNALLGKSRAAHETSTEAGPAEDQLRKLPLDQIQPGRYQPPIC